MLTSNTYGHVLEQRQRAVAVGMDAVLGERTDLASGLPTGAVITTEPNDRVVAWSTIE